MLAHTPEFKEEIKKLGRQFDTEIIYSVDGVQHQLDNEDINHINLSFDGNILKSVMKKLVLDSNVEIPVDTLLTYSFILKVNDTNEYINYGRFIVYSCEKKEDTNSYEIICYDEMLKTMKDYERLNITYPITINNYLQALCNKVGLTFGGGSFVNNNKQILNELYLTADGKSLDYTFRDVLDEIAQATASTIMINYLGLLELRYINPTNDTIDEEYLKDVNVNFGETYGPVNVIVFSRSEDSDNIAYPEVLPENPCELKIKDNQILNGNNRDEYIRGIYTQLNGLTYTINDYVSTGIMYYEVCDKYNVQIGETTYPCIMFNNEIDISNGIVQNIYTDMPEQAKTDYSKTTKSDKTTRQTYLMVDKQNGTIQSVVSDMDRIDREIGDRSGKQTTVTQDLDRIEAEITEIVDVTKSASSDTASIPSTEFTNIAPSYPVKIEIRPIVTNISLLYPNSGLYPSNNLYMPIRKFIITNTKYPATYEYDLDYDLLYYDENTYDSFVFDYENNKIIYTLKCMYDSDGLVVVRSVPVVHEIEITQEILDNFALTAGDYSIQVVGYTQGYVFMRLVVANAYTEAYATKVELRSSIAIESENIKSYVGQYYETIEGSNEKYSLVDQKADQINIEVGNKVGKNQVIASINLTPETATINANKINIQGTITAINNNTTTTINGSKITTGTIDTAQLKANAVNADKIQAGAITASKVDSSIITTTNLSAQTISCNQLSGGTITGQTINGGSVTGSTISGGSININNQNSYYLRMGADWTRHPEVSGLNVGSGGIDMNGHAIGKFGGCANSSSYSITSGTNLTLTGSNLLYLRGGSSSSSIMIYTSAGYKSMNSAYLARNPNDTSKTEAITQITGNNDTYLRMNTSVVLKPHPSNGGAYIWGTEDYNKILTKSGSPSTLSIKENVKKKDISNIPSILRQIDLYNYKYKEGIEGGVKDYGYIIDYLEKIDGIKDYFTFNDIERNGFKYKAINHEHLEKFLLGAVITLQKQIDELEEKYGKTINN